MSAIEIMQAIGRVRRAMPRNADVMLICDELEKALAPRPAAAVAPAKPKFDKTAYQRNLMAPGGGGQERYRPYTENHPVISDRDMAVCKGFYNRDYRI
jgi:hypothetical protein